MARHISNPWNTRELNRSAAEALALDILTDGINLDYERLKFAIWREDLVNADDLSSTFRVIEDVPELVFVYDGAR